MTDVVMKFHQRRGRVLRNGAKRTYWHCSAKREKQVKVRNGCWQWAAGYHGGCVHDVLLARMSRC